MFKKLFSQLSLLKIKGEDINKVISNPHDKFSALVRSEDTLAMSLKDNEYLNSFVFEANQTVLLTPNLHLSPRDGWIYVSYHPDLAMQGCLVSAITPLISTKEAELSTQIGLIIRTTKKVDLTDLPYFIKLYYI